MVLSEINHKMPIYKDCTLGEVVLVSLVVVVSLVTTLSILTKCLFGYGAIGCVIALALFVHTSRFILGRLQKLKFGKPYGYYYHFLLKKISQSALAGLIPVPFLQRQGKWSVRRYQRKNAHAKTV